MKVGIHQKRNEKRTGERTGSKNSRPPSLLVFFFVFTSDIRSIERTFAFIIYLKIGIHWTNKQRDCFSVYPPRESRGVEKEVPRNDDGQLRESTGIEVRLLQRGKNVASFTSGSRNQVVARNLPVLSRFRRNVHVARKELHLNSLLPAKDNRIILEVEFEAFARLKNIFFIVVRHTDRHNIYFISEFVYLSIRTCFR